MMLPSPILIVVTGPPCSGKTSLSRKISMEFSLPVVNKDGIKEILFNTLGWQDRSWSIKLGVSSLAILFDLIDRNLEVGQSIIAESNFNKNETEPFRRLIQKYVFRIIQVYCKADIEVLIYRFSARADSDLRHSGHVEELQNDSLKKRLDSGIWGPLLDINSYLITVDTTHFEKINYSSIFKSIKDAIEP